MAVLYNVPRSIVLIQCAAELSTVFVFSHGLWMALMGGSAEAYVLGRRLLRLYPLPVTDAAATAAADFYGPIMPMMMMVMKLTMMKLTFYIVAVEPHSDGRGGIVKFTYLSWANGNTFTFFSKSK